MSTLDLRKIEQTLKTIEAGTAQLLGNRAGLAVEKSSDSSDEAQCGLDRELTALALDREFGRLCAVRLALQRIVEGNYGVCQRCEEEIGAKRLAAVPWAAYCICCQESVDKEQNPQFEVESRQATAA